MGVRFEDQEPAPLGQLTEPAGDAAAATMVLAAILHVSSLALAPWDVERLLHCGGIVLGWEVG